MHTAINVINSCTPNRCYHFNSESFEPSLLDLVKRAHPGSRFVGCTVCSLIYDKPREQS